MSFRLCRGDSVDLRPFDVVRKNFVQYLLFSLHWCQLSVSDERSLGCAESSGVTGFC